jgi:hypothetical protein
MKFLIAIFEGGLPEMEGRFSYTEKEEIEAETKEKALEIYESKHDCSYFYAEVLAEINKEGAYTLTSSGLRAVLK